MRKLTLLMLTLSLGLLMAAGALTLVNAPHVRAQPQPAPAAPQASIRYVSSVSGDDSGGNDCLSDDAPCRTIQHAVDQADAGDEIRIAAMDNTTATLYQGTGTGAVVTLDKSLDLQGGYTYLHSDMPPVATWQRGLLPLPSRVDGEEQRRVLHASGDITVTLGWLALVNGSANRGGNLYAEGVYLRLTATPVASGTATYGGGLYLKDCRTDVDPGDLDVGRLLDLGSFMVVYHNTATYGGGVYIEGGTPTLAALAAYSNTATEDGGGFFIQGGTPVVAGSLVRGNRAGSRGGGLYLDQSYARVLGTTVTSNTAATGGGLYLNGPQITWPIDAPLVANGYVRHNRSTGGQGGGLYLREAVAGLLNLVVTDNDAADGAGLYLWAASPRVYQATVAHNTGGSGVYVTHKPPAAAPPYAPVPSFPELTNAIVASHTVGLYVDDTGLPYPLQNRATLKGTLWWANVTASAGGGEVAEEDAVTADPRFTCIGDPPTCALPYHLRNTSGAIDAGVTWNEDIPGFDTLVDIDGQLRPSGAGFDIGADEVVSRAYSVWLIPPLSTALVEPPATVTHTHQLLNSGLETDTYDLVLHSSQGWSTLLTGSPITLGAQASATVRVRVDVPADIADTVTDTAVITATSRSDPDTRARALDLTGALTGTATLVDLAVDKRADRDAIAPGEAVHYALTLTQTGELTTTHVVTLVDTLVPTRAIAAWDWPAHCAGLTRTGTTTCTWSLPPTEGTLTRTLSATITTTATYSGWLTNQARVFGTQPDLQPGNNVAAALVSVGEVDEVWIYLPVMLREG